jgi:hypothetical protein
MEDEVMPERPAPRSSAEIFADLRALAQSDGALHEISAIIYRDWVVTVDTQEGRVTDDPEHRWSTSKLNKNELMLLLGLTVQSQSDRTFGGVRDAVGIRFCAFSGNMKVSFQATRSIG